MTNQVRQGDVFLERVSDDTVPTQLKKVAPDEGRVILAYGEVTGHAHAIEMEDAELFEVPGSRLPGSGAIDRLLKVLKETWLTHEEHGRIKLEPGWYRVGQQREYTPGAIRQVAD